ncbi:Beta-glucosidase 11, partial [Mucuna pruriens]
MLKVFAVIELVWVIVQPSAHALSRDEFPPDFVFGASTSAYQVEGAANEDGRKPSIWDTFSHAGNGKMYEGDGDVACDQYHKYKEDVQLMANMGLEAYRFSISWSRVIPGIQPHVTLQHWDLPQTLDDEYGGWVSRRIVKDFTTFADVCFREFGDRVKYWTTVNEANVYAAFGYDVGMLPPQRCSPSSISNCSRGNSSTEPYMVAHHMLLAHASAARLYRKKYQGMQRGLIGFNLLPFGLVPLTNSIDDVTATQRVQDFFIGFMNPFTFGDYPDIMKKNAGSRLPSFTQKESNMVRGSIDFLGINFYYSFYVKNSPGNLQKEGRDYFADMSAEIESQQTPHNSSLDDWERVKYLQAYIGSLVDALRSGSNVKGYFVWSFLDVLELLGGYESSYGLYYVDMNDPSLRRQPKLSAEWYSNFLKRKPMDPMITTEIEKNVLSHNTLLHNAI